MKALVKTKRALGLELQDVEMPICAPCDVLIKVHKTAICGTDLHIYLWDEWAQNTIKTPRIIGHEFCGEIVEMGMNNQGYYKIGDIVTAEGHIVSGNSRNVRTSNLHLAKDTLGLGIHRNGAFAEYVTVPETNIWQPRHKNFDKNVIASFDPLGNAVHTALSWNLAGEDVLITGAGPVGLMAIAVCKFVGARNVVITDINPYRLDIAKKMGASTVNLKTDSLKHVRKELNIEEGFDIGLEMSGVPSALNNIIEHLIPGGKISLLGLLPSHGADIDFNKIIFKGLLLKGIYGREMFDTWYKMDALIEKGLDIYPVLTGNYHYSDFQTAFDTLISGNAGKLILDWTD